MRVGPCGPAENCLDDPAAVSAAASAGTDHDVEETNPPVLAHGEPDRRERLVTQHTGV